MNMLPRIVWPPVTIALIALSLCSCQKPAASSPVEETPETPSTSSPVVKAEVTATPVPPPIPEVAAPTPNPLAPDGVYFLTASVSVETADGIVGLRPGARAVKQPDGRFLVDGNTLDLRPDQITNDLRVASRAAGADQAAQAAIRQSLQAQAAPPKAASPGRAAGTPPPSAPQPAAAQADAAQPTPARMPPTGGLQSSTALGAGHTRIDDGYLWQKSGDGQWWIAVKRLDGKPMQGKPDDRPAR